MPKIIRRSCFETNSSSCHSLTFVQKEVTDIVKSNIESWNGKEITVELGGWYDQDYTLTSVEEKLGYIFADLTPNEFTHYLIEIKYDNAELDKFLPDMQEYIDAMCSGKYSTKSFNEEVFKEWLNVPEISELIFWFENLTGAKIEFVPSPDGSGWVGVDHESCGLGSSLIPKGQNKYELQAFLFDRNNYIETGSC